MSWGAVKEFEKALCQYTGARYAVAVSSCTAALQLALEWCDRHDISRPQTCVSIPKRTYVSVPCAVRNAGCWVNWRDEDWKGVYQLKPYPVWDCALRFTSGMYAQGQFLCVSFAAAKILGAEQGGAILHDSTEADPWLRRMRYDGRNEGLQPAEDDFTVIGHHFPMIPSIAAELHLRLSHLPQDNADQIRTYPDLSKHAVFTKAYL